MIYYNYYYLLYKLTSSSIYWIVDESDEEAELLNSIKKFESNVENYFIVKKIYSSHFLKKIINLSFKRFRIFDISDKCEILYKTK